MVNGIIKTEVNRVFKKIYIKQKLAALALLKIYAQKIKMGE